MRVHGITLEGKESNTRDFSQNSFSKPSLYKAQPVNNQGIYVLVHGVWKRCVLL